MIWDEHEWHFNKRDESRGASLDDQVHVMDGRFRPHIRT